MDYTTCAVPFAFLIGLLSGIGFTRWCMRGKSKPQEQPTNGLHVLNEVKAVVDPKPLARYERDIVQVFIDMDKRGTMWNDPTD